MSNGCLFLKKNFKKFFHKTQNTILQLAKINFLFKIHNRLWDFFSL